MNMESGLLVWWTGIGFSPNLMELCSVAMFLIRMFFLYLMHGIVQIWLYFLWHSHSTSFEVPKISEKHCVGTAGGGGVNCNACLNSLQSWEQTEHCSVDRLNAPQRAVRGLVCKLGWFTAGTHCTQSPGAHSQAQFHKRAFQSKQAKPWGTNMMQQAFMQQMHLLDECVMSCHCSPLIGAIYANQKHECYYHKYKFQYHQEGPFVVNKCKAVWTANEK